MLFGPFFNLIFLPCMSRSSAPLDLYILWSRLCLYLFHCVMTGHAFEARIYAENVPKGFLPAAGVLHHYHPVTVSTTGDAQ